MEEKMYTEEELVQKHKKERKELQARIQSLKKSICKGDKKKKKEVSEEIAHMESDLDKQQEEELTRLKLMQVNISNENDTKEDTERDEITNLEAENDEGGSNPSSTNPVPRISKAQKRREKKANAEKERNQRIIEQEALNVFGKRNVEIQTINEILCQRGLMIHEIPSDGHCLYNAVAHQLKTIGESPPSLHDLRKKTAGYLRENMNDCLPFMSNSESDTMLSPEQYEKYCYDVAHTSAWGGAVELRVLSRVLQCPIEVIHASGNPYVFGDEYNENKKLIVTYHRHMYELGAHYNSVMQYVKVIDES